MRCLTSFIRKCSSKSRLNAQHAHVAGSDRRVGSNEATLGTKPTKAGGWPNPPPALPPQRLTQNACGVTGTHPFIHTLPLPLPLALIPSLPFPSPSPLPFLLPIPFFSRKPTNYFTPPRITNLISPPQRPVRERKNRHQHLLVIPPRLLSRSSHRGTLGSRFPRWLLEFGFLVWVKLACAWLVEWEGVRSAGLVLLLLLLRFPGGVWEKSRGAQFFS